MNATTSQKAILARLIAVAMLVTCGVASVAQAQFSGAPSAVTIRFTLPFKVYWGAKIVPAGEYTMRMDPGHPAPLVQSTNGTTAFYTPFPIRNQSDKGPASLVVVVRGNERMVRSLNLPQNHISLVYKPITSAEREILAKADQLREVPITTEDK